MSENRLIQIIQQLIELNKNVQLFIQYIKQKDEVEKENIKKFEQEFAYKSPVPITPTIGTLKIEESASSKIEKLLDLPIEDFIKELPTKRARTILLSDIKAREYRPYDNKPIKTIRDFVVLTHSQVLNIRQCGKTLLKQYKDALEELGIKWKVEGGYKL